MTGSTKVLAQTASPDDVAGGLIEGSLDPLRYGGQVLDPNEVSGIITRLISIGARVLEVGCGTGSLSRIVVDTCQAELIGLEPDVDRAERARQQGLRIYTGYLSQELVREIGLFDIVLLADVLEHLADPQAMLSLCREALKPGGSIIISVPNVGHWSVRANLLRGKFKYESHGIMDATHLRWFTAATIRSLVASSGFKVTDYRATACPGLIDNACRRPLSWLPETYRARFLRFASTRWPTLFGAQHVLKAEVLSPPA